MSEPVERNFFIRMTATHQGSDNEVVSMHFEMKIDDEWTPVEVRFDNSSPYRVFLFSLLVCQNSYLYMNASERGVEIDETHAEASIRTVDYRIVEMNACFHSSLHRGQPSLEDASYFCERMLQCPVSRNLESADKSTTLRIGGHEVTLDKLPAPS